MGEGEASWGSMLGGPNALECLEQSPETTLEETAGIQSLEQKPNPDGFRSMSFLQGEEPVENTDTRYS